MARKASKLLEQMRQSATNWKKRDLVTLFEGFGFYIKHGGDHDIVKHPNHPRLRFTLGRHNQLATWYVKDAVRLIDKLLKTNEIQEVDQDDREEENDNEF